MFVTGARTTLVATCTTALMTTAGLVSGAGIAHADPGLDRPAAASPVNLTKPYYFRTLRDPRSVAAADFDEDGNVDLVTGNQSSIGVLFGQGRGRFAGLLRIPTGLRVEEIVPADVDGDGHVDLAYAGGGDVGIRLGDGVGGFGEGAWYDVGAARPPPIWTRRTSTTTARWTW